MKSTMLEKILRPARMAMGCQLMILSSTPLVLQSVAAMTMKMMDVRRSKEEFIDVLDDLIVSFRQAGGIIQSDLRDTFHENIRRRLVAQRLTCVHLIEFRVQEMHHQRDSAIRKF